MTNKVIQFHAMPHEMPEIVDLLRGVDPLVHVYLWSRTHELVECTTPESQLVDSKQYFLILAHVGSLPLPSTTLAPWRDFPGVLEIDIPTIRSEGLGSIAIGAKTDDEVGLLQFKVWERFFRKLRKNFTSGAFLYNRTTGNGRYYKNVHATKAAIEAARGGLVLKGSGEVIFDFDRLPC